MESIKIKERYAERLNQLWNDGAFSRLPFLQRGYAVPDEVSVGALMFIGMNPSYKASHGEESFFYPVHGEKGRLHPYFRKFTYIADAAGMTWTHLDLLYVRETNQQNLRDLCEDAVGRQFAGKQFAISKEIIEQARPRILVVNNAYACRWLTDKNFNPAAFDVRWDEEIGTYRIAGHSLLEGTPVFFSSMLTGQRALDSGSFERLNWHIRFVGQKIK